MLDVDLATWYDVETKNLNKEELPAERKAVGFKQKK